MRILRFGLLAVLLTLNMLVIAACQTEAPQAQSTPAAPAAPATAATGASNPTSAPAASGPRQIPTASADTAVVHGIVREIDTKKALSEDQGVDIFLAQVLHTADNSMSISSLDKTSAPRSDPDKDGVFVFSNIPPGEYAVVIRGPISEVVARQTSDLSKDLVITVSAGQTLDLGEVLTKYP
jgi:hypothetical protein